MNESIPMSGREIAGWAFGTTTAQTRGATFLALAEMIKRQWVTVDYSDHTALWVRTRSGTEVLAETVTA
jgi:hypothetical protein